jgi:hypothetical protein
MLNHRRTRVSTPTSNQVCTTVALAHLSTEPLNSVSTKGDDRVAPPRHDCRSASLTARYPGNSLSSRDRRSPATRPRPRHHNRNLKPTSTTRTEQLSSRYRPGLPSGQAPVAQVCGTGRNQVVRDLACSRFGQVIPVD